jgi:hypothetical protein
VKRQQGCLYQEVLGAHAGAEADQQCYSHKTESHRSHGMLRRSCLPIRWQMSLRRVNSATEIRPGQYVCIGDVSHVAGFLNQIFICPPYKLMRIALEMM